MTVVILAILVFVIIFEIGMLASHLSKKKPELNIGPIAAIAAFAALYIFIEFFSW